MTRQAYDFSGNGVARSISNPSAIYYEQTNRFYIVFEMTENGNPSMIRGISVSARSTAGLYFLFDPKGVPNLSVGSV